MFMDAILIGRFCALFNTRHQSFMFRYVCQVNKCGIVESVLSWVKFKAQSMLNKKCQVAKHSKLRGIPKLDDANDAGTKNSERCTLILTEGDSAKTLAVAGLSILGRDSYGVFPLRGKLLNVREATHKQVDRLLAMFCVCVCWSHSWLTENAVLGGGFMACLLFRLW